MAKLRDSLTRNRDVLLPVLGGMARGVRDRGDEFRHHVVRDAWTVAKRFAATGVVNIEKREIPCLRDAVVEGYLDDHQRMMLAGLAKGLGHQSFFEIGTNRGRTTWTMARNNPDMRILTLDVPLSETSQDTSMELGSDDHRFFRPGEDCGEAFHGTPEAERITQLWGDSASFDFSPYTGSIDLVYVDGAHTYDYVRKDTENALRILSPTGMIAWDDYGSHPDIHRYVNEVAATLDGAVYHVYGTRMAIWSRTPFVERLPYDDHASLPTV